MMMRLMRAVARYAERTRDRQVTVRHIRFVQTALWLGFIALCLTSGCAHTLGYAGEHPGYVYCKGKGVLTLTGSLAVGAGAGGGQANNVTVQADCDPNGFLLQQGSPPAPAVPALVPNGTFIMSPTGKP
jgi:hypothetical protein